MDALFELKDKYWIEINMRDNLSDIGNIIIDHSKLENSYNIAPSISPTGEKFAIYSNKSGNMSIYLVSTSNGKFLKSSYINGTKKFKVGDMLLTSGGAKIFPKDILVGKIIKVEEDNFLALPYVDFDNLGFVQVINTN